MINLGVVIPSSPGFIGTYQWLAVSALGVVGVDGEVAIAFSLLMQAVWFIPTTLVGGVIAIREVHREATRARARDRAASTIARVKVLLVSFYFPPAGGGGVQRPLKLAQYLPALGIETHVLAPDDPQWIHRDEALRVPTQAWVHRARYLGPIGRKPAEELHGKEGLARLATQARLLGRRALVPDENVSWNLTAIPAAIRLVREHEIDVVITTSPPNSIHLVGAAVEARDGRALGRRPARLARRPRPPPLRERRRAGEGEGRRRRREARRPLGRRDRLRRGLHRRRGARARAARAASSRSRTAPTSTTSRGSTYTPGERLRITHTGSFFGKRDPRPFLQALHDSGLDAVARFLGDFRSADREWAEGLGLGDRLELIPYAPRSTSLALQRDSEALLLLIPDAGGRGKGVLSGKVFEYIAAGRPILAAVPPDGAAADLIRETGAGIVAAPDDVDALREALARARPPLPERRACPTSSSRDEWRRRLARSTRVEETAELLRSLA